MLFRSEEISRERAQIPTQVIEVASSDAARLIGVEERTSAVTLDSVEFAEFAERASAKIKLLEELNSETIKRLERQGEVALKLENDLEQERAGRAETEKKLSETEAELKMFTEENVQLERQKAVAFGDIDRERSEALRPLWMNFTSLFSAMETVAIKFRRMEQDSDRMDGLEQDLANANQDLLNRNATIESLNRRRLNQGGEGTSVEVTFRTELAEIIPQLVKKQTSLAVILETLCIVFPDRVTVLEAAFESAKMSDTFLHVEKAFDLLWCLATTYWEQVQSNGDTVARKLFGNSYSAKEKTVLTNQGRERRTFVYCGERIQMDKHLKIGTADNASDTLRIHFEWIADEKRIVIGYCGKHLDF